MKAFLKRQFQRVKIIIVDYWKTMFFDVLNDTDFTKIGKYIMGTPMFIIMLVWTICVIGFSPLMLIILKDEPQF